MNQDELNGLSNVINPGGAGSTPGIGSALQSMMPLLTIVTILSLAVTILYGFSLVQRWRVNRAIIETRDILKAMQAAQQTPKPSEPPKPVEQPQTSSNGDIAVKDQIAETTLAEPNPEAPSQT
ncbi:MAG: hypothetical protein ABI397_00490 [Candidatus Saccharimonas sp.]